MGRLEALFWEMEYGDRFLMELEMLSVMVQFYTSCFRELFGSGNLLGIQVVPDALYEMGYSTRIQCYYLPWH